MTKRHRSSNHQGSHGWPRHHAGHWAGIILLNLLLVASSSPAQAVPALDTNAVIAGWIKAQTNLNTWKADFTQTRTMKTLTQPLQAKGKVWFAAPNSFHWELGEPAQTIAVRHRDTMMVIYPRLNRAERYRFDASLVGPWRDALALLEAGFPRNRNEVEGRFRILSVSATNTVYQLVIEPRDAAARRLVGQMRLGFATNDFSLQMTEIRFGDGSTMRNDFTNGQANPKIEEGFFEPKLGPEMKVTEPLHP